MGVRFVSEVRKSMTSLPVLVVEVVGAGFFSVGEGEEEAVVGVVSRGAMPLILLARAVCSGEVEENFWGKRRVRRVAVRTPLAQLVMLPATALVASPVVVMEMLPLRLLVVTNLF